MADALAPASTRPEDFDGLLSDQAVYPTPALHPAFDPAVSELEQRAEAAAQMDDLTGRVETVVEMILNLQDELVRQRHTIERLIQIIAA